jgi:hypothetical protein
VSLPHPLLVAIAPITGEPAVRAAGEKVRDLVQKRLRMSGVQLFWYHHRWLLPGHPYTAQQIAAWRDPLMEESEGQILEAIMNIGTAGGRHYAGRTVPLARPDAVFVSAASLPQLSDTGDLRAATPYRAGLTIVHEIRHLWQAAHRWDMADTRTCERDAAAFTKTWSDKVKEVVRRLQSSDRKKPSVPPNR